MVEKSPQNKKHLGEMQDLIRSYELEAEIIEQQNISPESVLKCSCVIADGKPMIVITSSDVTFDMQKLKRATAVQNVELAGEEELEKYFGGSCGSLNILMLPENVTLYADTKLFEKEWVVGSAGSPHAGLKINPREILKVQNIFITELAQGF